MDVVFETQGGQRFEIEIGYFDTISEIKEKIHKYREIPVSQQTLIHNGRILDDDSDTERSGIFHKSRIRLLIATAGDSTPPENQQKTVIKAEQLSPAPPLPSSPAIPCKIQLLLRFSTPMMMQPSVEVDLNDTVEQLKDKIHEIEGNIATSRLALLAPGNIEMQDQNYLREYNLVDGSEIDVSVRPATGVPAAPPAALGAARKLKVFVLPKCGTNKLVVEVNPNDKIQVLRSELENLQQRSPSAGFQLPTEGYFFIYKQNVMEEKESFVWHRVRPGDTIEIFNGSVSGGS